MRAKPPQDIDARMLSGCTGFVFVSVGSYLLTAWPFLLWLDAYRLSQVLITCGVGFVPAMVLGLIAARRWGVPGAAGFVGGALASALFLYMRLDVAEMLALARQTPPLDYPPTIKAIVPVGWVLLSAFVAIAFVPKER